MQITASLVKELRERTGAGMMECKHALVDADGDIERAAENMRKSGLAKADRKAGRVAAEGMVAIGLAADGKRAAMVEVNCETDFVARQEGFQEFAGRLARCVLDSGVVEVARLAELPVEAGASESVEELRRQLVARIGENITVRRACLLHSDGRVGAYSHGGRIGVLVDVPKGDEQVAKDLAMQVAASRPLAVDEAGIDADMLAKEKEIILAQVAQSGKPPEIVEKMVHGRLRKFVGEVTLLGQPFVKSPDLTVAKYLAQAGAEVGDFVRFEVGEGIEKKSEDFAAEVMAQVRGA